MTTTKNSMNNTIVPGVALAYVGIDLAKNSVHVHGVDASGRTCIDRKMRPGKLKEYLANLEPCVVGLEACGRAHQWGLQGSMSRRGNPCDNAQCGSCIKTLKCERGVSQRLREFPGCRGSLAAFPRSGLQ